MKIGIIESKKSTSATIVTDANTFIGGKAPTLNSKASLASKLNILESDITLFQIVGDNIEAYINVNYIIPNNCFLDDVQLTYYNDAEGKVTSIGEYAFSNLNTKTSGQLRYAIFPNATTVNLHAFSFVDRCEFIELNSCNSLPGNRHFAFNRGKIYIPVASQIGASNSVYDAVFEAAFSTSTIYCHPILQTINGGTEEPDITSARTSGATVSYLTNSNAPNVINNLSIPTVYGTALQLNFTAPNSVNPVDFYEAWVNGAYYSRIKSGGYITGLQPGVPYSISVRAVDAFYNKSPFSNIANQTTTSDPYPISQIVSYYGLDDNALDKVGRSHGIPTDITYATGVVGKRAVFNGSTSNINLGLRESLKLNSGTFGCIINSTAPGSNYKGIMGRNSSYNMYLVNGVLATYSFAAPVGLKTTGINLNDGNDHVVICSFQSGVTNGTKIYLEGNLVLTTTFSVSSQNGLLYIGTIATGNNINAKIDEAFFIKTIITDAEAAAITAKLLSGQPLI